MTIPGGLTIYCPLHHSRKIIRLLILSTLIFSCPFPASSAQTGIKAADRVSDNQLIDLNSEKYKQFFQELQDEHNFNKSDLQVLFKGVRINRKVLTLMDRQWESKPYYKYWPLFITPTVIIKGRKELRNYKQLFDRIEKQFGVDREIIVAIWGIESRFGTNMGGYSLFQSLNTLFDAYPRRSDFFRKELIQYLLLCRENNIDPLTVKGSYAGAFGQAQFMPSSFIEYAIDFDGDSRRDLISSVDDIFASIANYLKRYNWVLHGPVFEEIGSSLKTDLLVATYKQGRKGRMDWREVAKAQGVTLPRPQNNGQLSIIGLEKTPLFGGGIRYVAGYPNLHAITEYNHSNKYAMAVAEMAKAFKK